MNRILIFLLFLILTSNYTLGKTVIQGQIQNSSNKNIRIYITNTGDLTFDNYLTILKIKLDKNGFFKYVIDSLHYIHYYNYIEFKNKKIYFALCPEDSIIINFNENSFDLKFTGNGGTKNYFINEYYNKYGDFEKYSKERHNLKPIEYKATRTKRFNEEITLLKLDLEKYNLEHSFHEFQYQNLLYSYYNDIFMNLSRFLYQDSTLYIIRNLPQDFLSFNDTFNLNNTVLLNDIIYYSAISGYIDFKDFPNINLPKGWSCKDNFYKFSSIDSILQDEIFEYYKGYILMYWLQYCGKFPQNERKELKEILMKYQKDYKDEMIFNLVINKAKKKGYLKN
jgi:hypothetical protein